MCLSTICSISFANSLPGVDKRLIGRKFGGNLGSLSGFGKVITYFLPRRRKMLKLNAVISEMC
jgi:hypothetical protein